MADGIKPSSFGERSKFFNFVTLVTFVYAQALLTLFVWGYVHFTYIVNPKDCLLNVTDRPFPQDAIIQVEVYSNTSEIWLYREKALQDMYNKMYIKSHVEDFDRKSKSKSTAWIKDYCGTSFIINLTGMNFFCQLILSEIFKTLGVDKNSGGVTTGAEDSTEDKAAEDSITMDEEDSVTTDAGGNSIKDVTVNTLDGNSGHTSEATARETFYDMIFRGSTSRNSDRDDFSTTSFYSKNFTLYDLFEFYSKCGEIYILRDIDSKCHCWIA